MIHSDMEESMPTLASWIQMGCNSSNSIGRPQSELELATTISKFFEGGLEESSSNGQGNQQADDLFGDQENVKPKKKRVDSIHA